MLLVFEIVFSVLVISQIGCTNDRLMRGDMVGGKGQLAMESRMRPKEHIWSRRADAVPSVCDIK